LKFDNCAFSATAVRFLHRQNPGSNANKTPLRRAKELSRGLNMPSVLMAIGKVIQSISNGEKSDFCEKLGAFWSDPI
jgi:hypothetical protein